MAGSHRENKLNLVKSIDYLLDNYQVNLYSVVNMILRNADESLLKPPIDYNAVINRNLRFSSVVSWVPPSSTLKDVFYEKDEDLIKLKVSTVGVAGIIGGLPQNYSDVVSGLTRNKNNSLADYLDIYNHRINSLLYQSFQKHHIDLAIVSADKAPQTKILYVLAGWYSYSYKNLTGLDSAVTFNTVRYFIRSVCSTRDLELALSRILKTFVKVYSLAPRRYVISDETLSRLGGQNAMLGRNYILGDSFINWDSSIDVMLKGITFRDYYQYLRSPTSMIHSIGKLIKTFSKVTLRKLVIQLKPSEIKPLPIKLENCVRLGYNSWLESRSSHYENRVVLNLFDN